MGTPMNAMNLAMMAQSPKAQNYLHESFPGPGCTMPCDPRAPWGEGVADAASPCRVRGRMHQAQMGDCSGIGNSPMGFRPNHGGWSPFGCPEADTLRTFLGAGGLPSGAELAARLMAAAPESYED